MWLKERMTTIGLVLEGLLSVKKKKGNGVIIVVAFVGDKRLIMLPQGRKK